MNTDKNLLNPWIITLLTFFVVLYGTPIVLSFIQIVRISRFAHQHKKNMNLPQASYDNESRRPYSYFSTRNDKIRCMDYCQFYAYVIMVIGFSIGGAYFCWVFDLYSYIIDIAYIPTNATVTKYEYKDDCDWYNFDYFAQNKTIHAKNYECCDIFTPAYSKGDSLMVYYDQYDDKTVYFYQYIGLTIGYQCLIYIHITGFIIRSFMYFDVLKKKYLKLLKEHQPDFDETSSSTMAIAVNNFANYKELPEAPLSSTTTNESKT